MSIDLSRAAAFMAGHARILDRRRFEALTADSDAAREAIVRGLDAYRNTDGGYGWGLEPDLRASESQPGGALHALEALADVGPATSQQAPALLDWLNSATYADGGLPFALPIADPTGSAPFWVHADPQESSLQITAAVTAQAHRVARWDDSVRDHPWLATATRHCFDAIRRIDEPPFAYVLSFAVQFLDAVADTHPAQARELIGRIGRFIPGDGAIAVDGGAEGETLHLLDLSPAPDRPSRELLDPQAVSDDLDRLERGQLADGGWTVDFDSYSEAASLEWRGYVTVGAIDVLRRNGRVS